MLKPGTEAEAAEAGAEVSGERRDGLCARRDDDALATREKSPPGLG